MRLGFQASIMATLLVLAGGLLWLDHARNGVSVEASWGMSQPVQKPLERTGTALNPHGLSRVAVCESIVIEDPAAEARANIAKEDRRPYMVYGFTPGDVPGVYCASGNYRMEGRVGIFVSDLPDACGGYVFSNASPDKMQAYNRVLASDAAFQKITGCRPST